jgi:V-type H+-transporting ATPase subunit E
VKGMLKEVSDLVSRTLGLTVALTLSKSSLSDDESWGGVLLTTTDGRITCNNTLAYRASHCFNEQLPTIRYLLFHESGRPQ